MHLKLITAFLIYKLTDLVRIWNNEGSEPGQGASFIQYLFRYVGITITVFGYKIQVY